ncbi:unnamed protein product [Coffea canephora]|uniref:Uncharacterized protein n=1 Tax=Coffea canephora TaxID=49390 RepID=A0A068TZB9_COFCA|nr:unnamed protein product [Coffea canephora]
MFFTFNHKKKKSEVEICAFFLYWRRRCSKELNCFDRARRPSNVCDGFLSTRMRNSFDINDQPMYCDI